MGLVASDVGFPPKYWINCGKLKYKDISKILKKVRVDRYLPEIANPECKLKIKKV